MTVIASVVSVVDAETPAARSGRDSLPDRGFSEPLWSASVAVTHTTRALFSLCSLRRYKSFEYLSNWRINESRRR